MTPRLKNNYTKTIVPNLINKLSLKNKNQAPKITKVVLNMGLGEDSSDNKKVKSCMDDLSTISGQKLL